MDPNRVTSDIIKAAIAVHRELGPGLLESVYRRCMIIELNEMGLPVETELPVAVRYRNHLVQEDGLRLDLLVDKLVIVELKSVEQLKDVHKKQLLTYLKLTGKTVGLLINFNESLLKNGIVRIVQGFVDNPQADPRF